jgi:hypothetical protein
MHPQFHFDRQQLLEVAAATRDRYRQARPFPHAYFDGLFPAEVLDEVLGEFPAPDQEGWLRFDSERERKLASVGDRSMGDATRHLLAEFNSAAFIDFLQELTGIGGLVPDPHFEGGGMHQIMRGGHLDVHVDFNRHPATGLDRRLNVLLYLNREWEPAWGGELQLWSQNMKRCEQRIIPVFNRLVVFSTTERSFHGHPEPLSCPEDRSRRSLALYYYSKGRPEENGAAPAAHNTVWGEEVSGGGRARAVARRLAPPILVDAARAARRHRA